MRRKFFLLVACKLLLLGIIVPMNSVTAGVPNELRAKLDEIEALSADIHKLVEEEGVVVQESQTTTNRELELRLQRQHQAILQEIGKKNDIKLRTLHEAVDLLKGYAPASRRDWEAVTRQTERIVKFLKWERDGILGDPDSPDELVSERGIDKLLEEAVNHLRVLYSEEQQSTPEKSQFPKDKVTEKQLERPEKHEATEQKRKDGFMAWFDRQETAVQAALIAAIVSIIGTLATVVIAAIRRRD